MERVILLRFSEIFLKGNNRKFFEKKLIDNIKETLKSYEYRFSTSQNRYVVSDYDVDLETEIVERLKKVFGIYSLSVANKVKTDFDEIRKAAVDLFDDTPLKFRVTVRRADKRVEIPSPVMAAEIGGDILEKYPETLVDLTNFDKEVYVDIRENGYTYIFLDKIHCAGGMPVGSSGKALCLLSGGIDSPVAAYMMAKRGLQIDAIHFHSMPYTSEQAKEKVVSLAKIVSAYAGHIKLHVVPFTEIQEQIRMNCPEDHFTLIMRRFMMRLAQRVADEVRAKALVTGECLGQVASQTMEALRVSEDVVELPVLRPLIGMDKEEIIRISRKIGTFDTSILPYEDCCTVFTPRHPKTKPSVEEAREYESALDVEGLCQRAMANREMIRVKPTF